MESRLTALGCGLRVERLREKGKGLMDTDNSVVIVWGRGWVEVEEV